MRSLPSPPGCRRRERRDDLPPHRFGGLDGFREGSVAGERQVERDEVGVARALQVANSLNKMLTVSVETRGNSVSIGTPVPLFDISLALAGDISADHNRFLLAMSSNARQNEPITLVTNWPATLHK